MLSVTLGGLITAPLRPNISPTSALKAFFFRAPFRDRDFLKIMFSYRPLVKSAYQKNNFLITPSCLCSMCLYCIGKVSN